MSNWDHKLVWCLSSFVLKKPLFRKKENKKQREVHDVYAYLG